MQDNNVVIATHNGAFHADDVFGVAVLKALYPQAEVVRTRDSAVVAAATFAVDVGGIWDAPNGRFDHHQKGFDGVRENGVVYASAGLVWATYGAFMVTRVCPRLTLPMARKVAEVVDQQLVQQLDMVDTGQSQVAPGYFGLSALVSAFNTTRDEEELRDQSVPLPGTPEQLAAASANLKLQKFLQATKMVEQALVRVILQVEDELTGAEIVRGAERVLDGRVLVLPQSGLSWYGVVCNEMPDVLFVVYPDSTDKQYQLRTVPVEPESFKARKDLPAPWAGLRDADLAKVTAVPDAVFCHNARFIGGAGSLQGTLRMAELALAD